MSARPNGRLEDFLAEHVVDSQGVCSCGWDLANYDVEPYDFGFSKETVAEANRRAWIAHLEKVWRRANPLGKIQRAETTDMNGGSVVLLTTPIAGQTTIDEALEESSA